MLARVGVGQRHRPHALSRGMCDVGRRQPRAVGRASWLPEYKGNEHEEADTWIAEWKRKLREEPETLGKKQRENIGTNFEYLLAVDEASGRSEGQHGAAEEVRNALESRGASVTLGKREGLVSKAAESLVSIVDGFELGTGIRLVGDGFGALAAASCARQRPEAIDSLLLLSPPFEASEALAELCGGEENLRRWEEEGHADVRGRGRVPWEFASDAISLASAHGVRCRAMVVHGHRDAVAPIRGSSEWVRRAAPGGGVAQRRLLEVDEVNSCFASALPSVLTFLDLPLHSLQ